jgi:hypothetical protein
MWNILTELPPEWDVFHKKWDQLPSTHKHSYVEYLNRAASTIYIYISVSHQISACLFLFVIFYNSRSAVSPRALPLFVCHFLPFALSRASAL